MSSWLSCQVRTLTKEIDGLGNDLEPRRAHIRYHRRTADINAVFHHNVPGPFRLNGVTKPMAEKVAGLEARKQRIGSCGARSWFK